MTTKNNKDKKTLRQMFWRSLTLSGTWNYVNAQGIAIGYMMLPFLKKKYKNEQDDTKLKEAMKRSIGYYNVTPAVSTFPIGISSSMEEENARLDNFDTNSINAVKASLMGPLSGIGDSFFWGTFRVIAGGIGISLATQGNILGPILFLLLYNIPHLFVRFYGLRLGYNLGSQFIKKAFENGVINILTKSATMLGLIMVGAMIFTTIPFETTLSFNLSGEAFSLQNILDDVMKGILPLIATMTCFTLIRKKVNANFIILGILLISFIFAFIGVA
ncbi:PTS system mannose/fructose/sorbose family transporter subunit IID [Amphibacillus sp. Q70]|uniref:PTS system mannose/fructose/sorbose family transporter subunit IID n=1 Tax=Amphibacillus sp. Q70 TaxID=3453416 RepID=UPI003F871C3D